MADAFEIRAGRADEATRVIEMYEWLFAPPGDVPPGWDAAAAARALARGRRGHRCAGPRCGGLRRRTGRLLHRLSRPRLGSLRAPLLGRGPGGRPGTALARDRRRAAHRSEGVGALERRHPPRARLRRAADRGASLLRARGRRLALLLLQLVARLMPPPEPPPTRAGFVGLAGRPNVGKSTLVNAIVGAKVAITRDRPQTTRRAIRGVATAADHSWQAILIDLPGVQKPRDVLTERMQARVEHELADADVVARRRQRRAGDRARRPIHRHDAARRAHHRDRDLRRQQDRPAEQAADRRGARRRGRARGGR